MKTRFNRTLVLALLMLVAAGSAGFAAQSWMKNRLILDISNIFDVRLSQEKRFDDTVIFAGDTFYENIEIGVFGHLPWNFHLGTSYRREQTLSVPAEEQRIIVELGWKLFLLGLIRFDLDAQFHYRDQLDPVATTFESYYLNARLTFGLRLGDLRFYPFIGYQGIIGDIVDPSFSFDNFVDHQAQLGLGFQVRWGIRLNLFYTYQQDPVNNIVNNIINTGLDFNF